MESKIIWFHRKFKFDLPAGMFPMVVERLRGTPARLEERTRDLPLCTLTRCQDKTWTILENVGHLLVAELLWDGRVDDFLEEKKTLRPADLQNLKTHEGNFNATPLETLLKSFRKSRENLVGRFDRLSEEDAELTALHPRLEQPMRMIDHAFFIAEHDDHHLARITDLINTSG